MTQDKSWGDLFEESGEAAGPLPDAEYDFVIRKVTSKKTSNGKPMYMARCEVETGQYAKRTIFHNFVVSSESPDAMRIFFQQMGSLGMNKEFWRQNPSDDRICQALEGRRFRATTTVRQWQGEDRNNLGRIKAAAQNTGTGAPPPPPAANSAPPPAPAPQAAAAPPPPIVPAPGTPSPGAPAAPSAVSPSPEAPGQPAQPAPPSPNPASPSVPASPSPQADPTQPANPASAPTTNPTTPPSAPNQTPSAPNQTPSAPTTTPSAPNQTPSSQVPSSVQETTAPVPPATPQPNGHTPTPGPDPDVEAATLAAQHYEAQKQVAPVGAATLPPPPQVEDPPF